MGYRLAGPEAGARRLGRHPVGGHADRLAAGARLGPADSADGRPPDDRRLPEDRDRHHGRPADRRTAGAGRLDRVRALLARPRRAGRCSRSRSGWGTSARDDETGGGRGRVRRRARARVRGGSRAGRRAAGAADHLQDRRPGGLAAGGAGQRRGRARAGGGERRRASASPSSAADSNVLVADRGVRGLVLRVHGGVVARPAPDRVRADAGVTMNGLVRWTIARGLGGLEAWAGTPGTVGGAIHGNAHFQGRLIGERVARVKVASRQGEPAELEPGGHGVRLRREPAAAHGRGAALGGVPVGGRRPGRAARDGAGLARVPEADPAAGDAERGVHLPEPGPGARTSARRRAGVGGGAGRSRGAQGGAGGRGAGVADARELHRERGRRDRGRRAGARRALPRGRADSASAWS